MEPDSDVPVSNLKSEIIPFELTYAPPEKRKSRAIWVIVAGLATTALTLAGLCIAEKRGDVTVMNWYFFSIVPIGGILAGLAASSGYALLSWILGVKVRKGLLAAILVLMVTSFFAAKYGEFIAQGPIGVPVVKSGSPRSAPKVLRQVGFWEYFHVQATNWRISDSHSLDRAGVRLGIFGYFIVLLSLAGFAGAGLIIPMLVGLQPYCELCERYMNSLLLASWPAGTWAKSPLPSQVAAYVAEQHALLENALLRLDHLRKINPSQDTRTFFDEIVRGRERKGLDQNLTLRLSLYLDHCPVCMSGHIRPVLIAGVGNNAPTPKLTTIDLTPATIRSLLQMHNEVKPPS